MLLVHTQCMLIFVYIYIYIYIHTHTHTYIHTHTRRIQKRILRGSPSNLELRGSPSSLELTAVDAVGIYTMCGFEVAHHNNTKGFCTLLSGMCLYVYEYINMTVFVYLFVSVCVSE
jgi:hypothetical protein